jgi:hypothetical protein
MAERTQDSRAYLSPTAPLTTPIPFAYLGELRGHAPDGETIDHWVQDCGAKLFHFRPATDDAAFTTYAGGDPRKGGKKKTAGRAYLALESPSPFWQAVAVGSLNHHFKRADRYTVRPLDVTLEKELPLATGDTPAQAADLAVVNRLLASGELQIDVPVSPALGGRLQAKLALALGHALFDRAFASTPYAKELRTAFREADPAKLAKSKVRGSGILSGSTLGRAENVLRWPGAWLLWIQRRKAEVSLVVLSPSGKPFAVLISDDSKLAATLDASFDEGNVWLTVPAISVALGPIWIPDYVAHQLGELANSDLAALAARRNNPSSLPPCGF